MGKPVIKVEHLSKAYQIGQFGTGTISRDLERFWVTRVRGKEDPFLKIGEANDRSVKGTSNVVWSLRDINFEIGQGEAVGIIGKNGAGKSTLLKLLSRVTGPTSGTIKVKGRIASLLEVGTGFHPELSGRENIYLNGAILGMRKKEITRKLDEIIDFSGVERYIDTPVKRYSSGMYVRLAFAVAAHLESEILVVDEVLAVGDAEFQRKCLGKMRDISSGEGRTVLFVSHNMAAVQNLCSKGLLISNGQLLFEGNIGSAIDRYLNESATNQNSDSVVTLFDNSFRIMPELSDKNGVTRMAFSSHDDIVVKMHITSEKPMDFKDYVIELKITDVFGNVIATVSTYLSGFQLNTISDKFQLIAHVGHLNLIKGNYQVNLVVVNYNDPSRVVTIENFTSIEIIDTLKANILREINPKLHGNLALQTTWEITRQ